MPSARRIASLLVLALILTTTAPHAQGQKDKEGILITTAELFTGELERLKYHICSQDGCLKLDNPGAKVFLYGKYQVWRDGKLSEEKPVLSRIDFQGKAEVSITVQVVERQGKLTYKVVTVFRGTGRTVAGPLYIDVPKQDPPEQQWIASSRHQSGGRLAVLGELSVWAWARGDRPSADRRVSTDLFGDAVNNAKWALVLKLSAKKE